MNETNPDSERLRTFFDERNLVRLMLANIIKGLRTIERWNDMLKSGAAFIEEGVGYTVVDGRRFFAGHSGVWRRSGTTIYIFNDVEHNLDRLRRAGDHQDSVGEGSPHRDHQCGEFPANHGGHRYDNDSEGC